MATPKYIVNEQNREEKREATKIRDNDREQMAQNQADQEEGRPNRIPGSDTPGAQPIPDPENA